MEKINMNKTIARDPEQYTLLGTSDNRFDHNIYDSCNKYNVDPSEIKILLGKESNFNPNLRGKDGDLGIAQFMPSWVEKGKSDWRINPEKSIDKATWLFRKNMDKYPGPYSIEKAYMAHKLGTILGGTKWEKWAKLPNVTPKEIIGKYKELAKEFKEKAAKIEKKFKAYSKELGEKAKEFEKKGKELNSRAVKFERIANQLEKSRLPFRENCTKMEKYKSTGFDRYVMLGDGKTDKEKIGSLEKPCLLAVYKDKNGKEAFVNISKFEGKDGKDKESRYFGEIHNNLDSVKKRLYGDRGTQSKELKSGEGKTVKEAKAKFEEASKQNQKDLGEKQETPQNERELPKIREPITPSKESEMSPSKEQMPQETPQNERELPKIREPITPSKEHKPEDEVESRSGRGDRVQSERSDQTEIVR